MKVFVDEQPVNVSPIVFREKKFKKGFNYGPHKHERIEINYIKKGSCCIRFDNEMVKFRNDSCMLIFPDVPHHFHSDNHKDVTVIQLELLISDLDQLSGTKEVDHSLHFFQSLHDRSMNYLKIRFNATLKNCLQRIIYEESNRNEHFQHLRKIYYQELFILLSHIIKQKCKAEAVFEHPVVKKAIHHIRENYFAPEFSLETIAGECAVTPRSLRRLFKHYLNMSPVDYMNQVKINRAKKLLLYPDNERINEIAYSVGYNSPQYFCRIFKKYTGHSPLDFRNVHLQESG